VVGREKDGLRMIEDAHKDPGIDLTKQHGLRNIKFKDSSRKFMRHPFFFLVAFGFLDFAF
jgi:hypothetical protein